MMISAQAAQAYKNTLIFQDLIEPQIANLNGHLPKKDIPYALFRFLQAQLPEHLPALDLSIYPPHPSHYQRYIVYNYAEEKAPAFSLTLIVFAPGQKTSKHSHRVDCAPICLKGVIKETLYEEVVVDPSIASGPLKTLKIQHLKPFEGGYLYQHQPNIHCLENPTEALAMSLHLYLFDARPNRLGQISTSILKVYP